MNTTAGHFLQNLQRQALFGLAPRRVMPNHWHFMLRPKADGDLTAFCRRLAHTQRWHAHHGTAGTGHLYPRSGMRRLPRDGRFKRFAVEPHPPHFRAVARYVERNPLRAGLVARAEDWRWSSLWRREQVGGKPSAPAVPLADRPVERPADWMEVLNRPQSAAEEAAVRQSVRRGRPYGSELWRRQTVERFGLPFTLRPPHRPKKSDPDAPAAAGRMRPVEGSFSPHPQR